MICTCETFIQHRKYIEKNIKKFISWKHKCPKNDVICLTMSQNWQGSKEFCYICYLLLWSSNLDLPKAGQLEKRHSFVFGFQVTITLDLQKKREDWCLYSLNLIARICRLDNFKSLHNMKILFGCISYFQQIFFGTVWKSINKTFVFPATLFQNWMASTAVRENICQLFFSRLDATTTLMKNEIWMTRWFFDLFFLLCLYETLIFLRKVSFHDEKKMLPLHIYFSSISAKCNIHDTF